MPPPRRPRHYYRSPVASAAVSEHTTHASITICTYITHLRPKAYTAPLWKTQSDLLPRPRAGADSHRRVPRVHHSVQFVNSSCTVRAYRPPCAVCVPLAYLRVQSVCPVYSSSTARVLPCTVCVPRVPPAYLPVSLCTTRVPSCTAAYRTASVLSGSAACRLRRV